MKKIITLLIPVIALLATGPALARDDTISFAIAEAMDNPAYQEKLGPQVRFFWGDQAHPEALQTFGEYASNKKTNAFGKADREACEWALLSALLSLRDRALQEGGNAVINIKSNYKSNEFVSNSEYQCGAGNIMAGVALKGTVVKLP